MKKYNSASNSLRPGQLNRLVAKIKDKGHIKKGEKNKMIIVGAGMSGLLAGALNPGSIIYEAGENKESDHQALFRCRKPDIGKMLGIPFKEILVHKAIWLDGKEVNSSPRITHMYSKKATGIISARSIFNISSAVRYIPPKDFIYQLKKRCNIKYNNPFNISDFEIINFNEPIISTIPIFKMAAMLGVKIDSICHCNPIYVNRIFIPKCNSYCTVYYPDPKFSAYRASITGDTLIIEGTKKLCYKDLTEIYTSLGIKFYDDPTQYKNHKQKFGKIIPIDNKIRQNIITDLTLKYGIYSLGRFATWRPKILLDDILEDIFVIRRLIEEGHYGSIKHRQEA